MKLVINYAVKLDSTYKAGPDLQNKTYASLVGTVNGIIGNESGPIPGFFVVPTGDNNEVKIVTSLAEAAKSVGLIASADIYSGTFEAQSGYTPYTAGSENISVLAGPGSIDIEAYAPGTYNVGDALAINANGVLEAAGANPVKGIVKSVNADGTLTVDLV